MAGGRLAAVLLAALSLGGCFGGDGEEAAAPTPTAAPGVPLHAPGGEQVSSVLAQEDTPLFALRTVNETWGWEPTVAIDSSGALFLPSESSPVLGVNHMRAHRSNDEGRTWTEITPEVAATGLPFPPTLSLDPYVYVDPATDRLYVDELRVECTMLAWSDDQGETWDGNPVACGNPIEDHQTLWAGPGDNGRVLHLCSNAGANTMCKRSMDGGRSFTQVQPPFLDSPGYATCGGMSGHGSTSLATGTRFIGKQCDEPLVARSTDGGLTWTSSAIPGAMVHAVFHDVEIEADAAGTVYAFFIDEEGRPNLSTSEDDGATWSEAVDVGFPGLAAASHPAVVAGQPGRVAWSYMGTTEVSGVRDWSLHVGQPVDAWSPAAALVTVDAGGRPLVRGTSPGGASQGGIGDFLDLDLMPDGRLVASLVDVCQGSCADPSGNGVADAPVGIAIQQSGLGPGPRLAASA